MTVLALFLPALVVVLVGLGGCEVLLRRRRDRRPRPIAGVYADELVAFFNGSKRIELDHRDSMSMMRDDASDGAPPRMGVDLEHGTVIMRPDQPGRDVLA